jgi:hypothetical protein
MTIYMLVLEALCLLGRNAMQPVEIRQTFRRNMSPSSLGIKGKQESSKMQLVSRMLLKMKVICCSENSVCFQRTTVIAGYSMLVSCLVYSSNLKMEETCSSETSFESKRTTAIAD